MQMPPEMIAAIAEDFADAARGWRIVSAHDATLTRLAIVAETPVEVIERHVTLTVESQVKGKAIIFMLEGPPAGAFTSGTAILNGSTFDFTDGPLLTQMKNALDLIGPANADAALQEFFGPVPEGA